MAHFDKVYFLYIVFRKMLFKCVVAVIPSVRAFHEFDNFSVNSGLYDVIVLLETISYKQWKKRVVLLGCWPHKGCGCGEGGDSRLTMRCCTQHYCLCRAGIFSKEVKKGSDDGRWFAYNQWYSANCTQTNNLNNVNQKNATTL